MREPREFFHMNGTSHQELHLFLSSAIGHDILFISTQMSSLVLEVWGGLLYKDYLRKHHNQPVQLTALFGVCIVHIKVYM